MQNSFDEISVEETTFGGECNGKVKRLKYLPNWPAVNIEFQDLNYTIPDIGGKCIHLFVCIEKKNKIQLRNWLVMMCTWSQLQAYIFSPIFSKRPLLISLNALRNSKSETWKRLRGFINATKLTFALHSPLLLFYTHFINFARRQPQPQQQQQQQPTPEKL